MCTAAKLKKIDTLSRAGLLNLQSRLDRLVTDIECIVRWPALADSIRRDAVRVGARLEAMRHLGR